MPKGYIKFVDIEKGFGYIKSDEGFDARIPQKIVESLKEPLEKGSRVDFAFFDGNKGPVVTSLDILNEPKYVEEKRKDRMDIDQLINLTEGVIPLLDDINAGLRRGHIPDSKKAKDTSTILRVLTSQLSQYHN